MCGIDKSRLRAGEEVWGLPDRRAIPREMGKSVLTRLVHFELHSVKRLGADL